MNDEAALEALYTRGLRDLATSIRADRRLVPADISVTRRSRTCGSSVTLDVRLDGDRLAALGWRTRACTLSMGATAVIVAHAPGRTFLEIARIAELLRRLLEGKDVSFPKPWGDLKMFAAAQNLRARHGAIMLPFEVLAEAALSCGSAVSRQEGVAD